MVKRKIIRGFINGESQSLESLGLQGTQVKTVWTMIDEERMWSSNSFNPFTGEPIQKGVDLDRIILQHGVGVLIEDQGHDWRMVRRDNFKYYSRYVPLGKPSNLLIEYEENNEQQ